MRLELFNSLFVLLNALRLIESRKQFRIFRTIKSIEMIHAKHHQSGKRDRGSALGAALGMKKWRINDLDL